jgi:fructokinase
MVGRRLLVVGESLVDIVTGPNGDERAPGGSPLNVAVGLARLGVPVRLATQVGDDPDGRLVVDHAAASGVELAPGSVQAGSVTSTATARLDVELAAAYDFDLGWDPVVPPLPEDPLGLHVGSLGTVVEPGRRAVLDLLADAARDDVFVSYDPNVRPAFPTTWQEARRVAAQANLVRLSDDDLAQLAPQVATADLAQVLLAADRTELVVVTRGGLGAFAFTADDTIDIVAPPVRVVDTVGAGDTFMAALLSILHEWELLTAGTGALGALDGDRLRLLLSGAADAAAVTVGRRGANPPTRSELPPAWPAG